MNKNVWVDPNDNGGHYDLIEVFAKAQLDYPEGVGVKHSLFCKRIEVGDKPLEKCSRPELNSLIWRLRSEYLFLKSKAPKSSSVDSSNAA